MRRTDVGALQAAANVATRSEGETLLARLTALKTTVAHLRAENQQLHGHIPNIHNISEQLGITMADQPPR